MPSSKSASKSAKAVRAAGKTSSSRTPGGGKGGLPGNRQIPWMAIGAAAVIIALIGALAYSLVPKYREQAELAKFTPSTEQQDPSLGIDGVVTVDYSKTTGKHVQPTERVGYDQKPPFGGSHDSEWADCSGTVYSQAMRNENAVHSLEHGAVWIAYDPDKVDNAAIDTLESKVDGKAYTFMSPYPDLDAPIVLQSWGHQLKLDSADDPRVNQFITALRQNPYTHPEVGGSCSNPMFDRDNPTPFDPTPPGPDAKAVDGSDVATDPTAGAPGGMIPGVPSLPGMPGLPAGQLPAQPLPGE